MKLTDICIKRPVLSTVMSLIIILLGIVAFYQLQVRQYPKIEQPQISIQTQLEGASPQIIESQVTKILEDVLAGLEGLYSMQSRSEQGESRITLTFNNDRDIDAASNDVRDKIGRVRNRLPHDTLDPRIKKSDADAQSIIYLSLYSEKHTIEELADYAYRFLDSQLQVIPGVAQVDIWGGGEYEMRVTLDPIKLASFHLTPEEISSALKKQNIERPAGSILTKSADIVLTTRAPLITEEDFRRVIVASREGSLVRLGDVATVTLATVETKNVVRFNDKPAIGIGLTKQSVANPLSIAQSLYKLLPRLQSSLPQGMHLDIANDQTVFIDRSISQVYKTLVEATILVILVILLFLRSFRAILIPIVTIPVSLIGAFFLMFIMGFSINILTLLALVLAIGLVVDDAIVMLENIYRHIEEGMKPMQAALKGAKEISFAVVAMTITLAAVYAPIALAPGMIGKLFTEFALTLAGSVLISGFVALTLTPMMCGRLLKIHKVHKDETDLLPIHSDNPIKSFIHALDTRIENTLIWVDEKYAFTLRKALDSKVSIPKLPPIEKLSTFKFKSSLLVLMIGAAVGAVGWQINNSLDSEFLPREDQGILRVRAVPPFGSNIEYVDRYMKQTEALIKAVPEVQTRLTIVSVPGESFSLNLMKPWEDRKRSTTDVANSLRKPMMDIPGLNAQAYSGGNRLGTGRSDTPFELVLKTTASFPDLKKKVNLAMKALGTMPELQDIEADIEASEGGQEYEVTINRDKAASLGIDVDTIAGTLDTLIGGKPITKFKKENKQFSVRIELEKGTRARPEEMSKVMLKGTRDRKETMVPLSELITIVKTLTPIEIGHVDGFRASTINARLKDGYGLGETLEKARTLVIQAVGDSQTVVDFAGESRRYLEERQNINLIFGLALAFIFLVLAAQYESWRDPWIILLSVPMSLTGGLLLLLLFGQTLNLYSQIGLVTLIGLITKHGILIVDFANKLKADGLERMEAVIEASRLRLRPILMTTFAMVLGAVPLAFSTGAGMESRQPIGLVVVGGMIVGTIFTLYVVPAVYMYLSKLHAAKDVEGFNHD